MRSKSARVVNFEQFKQALKELAPKRFKGKDEEEALQETYRLIAGKEPANIGVTVSASSLLSRSPNSPYSRVLKDPSDSASTTRLGSPFHPLTPLCVKKCLHPSVLTLSPYLQLAGILLMFLRSSNRNVIVLLIIFQKTAKAGAVDRLTDTAKFTGAHKERFDDTGKGRGRAGREELPDTSGYVGAYKGAGTYEEKVKESQ
ncbi:UNVERIFIED_CONTAM: hypothetical protein FKN15_042403 [Acipenser sinensis]